MDDDLLLLPRPRSLVRLSGAGAPRGAVVNPKRDTALAPEHYRLRVAEGQVELHCADDAGQRYGLETLRQLGHGRDARPAVLIEDGPDFPVRGYMLDVSRDRVPTRETLERIVELLALFRINHFELYTEHTFAYREHKTVWRDASPMTPEDLRWLDARCAARGVALVANQNTFGHMARWLKHPEYAVRAEAPDGYTTKLGTHLPPGVLEPTEDNACFALDLCRELLEHFSQRRINIGCDETFELGKGKSRKLVEAEGAERVYLEHLLRLVRGLRADGVEVSFWGDILRHHPELAAELPQDGVTALAWHYEAPMDPDDLPSDLSELLSEFGLTRDTLRGFDGHVSGFVEAGLPFWVCPGTSSWNTLIGRLGNARANLLDAARVGLARGASGYLITDWGDNGHMQPPSVSWPALAYGAALAWCTEANQELDVSPALDAWVFEDEAHVLGGLLDRIGHLYAGTGKVGMNGSPLFTDLLIRGGMLGSMGEASAEGTAHTIEALDLALEELCTARPSCSDGPAVRAELEAALRLARHGAWRIARAAGFPAPSDDELASDLREAIALQEAAWRARARPGGWPDSLARLEATLASYQP